MAKFEEVLPALRAGRKIRNIRWSKENYILIENNEFYMYSQEGRCCHGLFSLRPDLIVNDSGWEIVEEPITDQEIIEHFEQKARELSVMCELLCKRGRQDDAELLKGKMDTYNLCAKVLKERKIEKNADYDKFSDLD